VIYHGLNEFEDLPRTVDRAERALRPHAGRFDSIAVSGVSGLCVGAPVALRLGVPLVVVRKISDACHDDRLVIGADHLGHRWLFVDDFVSQGATRRHVAHEIARVAPCAVYAGWYLYRDDALEWAPPPDPKPPACPPPLFDELTPLTASAILGKAA
jgi:orotate phosphoribosyltransferase